MLLSRWCHHTALKADVDVVPPLALKADASCQGWLIGGAPTLMVPSHLQNKQMLMSRMVL